MADQDLSAFNTQLKAALQAHPNLSALAQTIAGQAGPLRQQNILKFKQGLAQAGVPVPPDLEWNESTQSFQSYATNLNIALPLLAAFTAGIAIPALVTSLSSAAATSGGAAALVPSVGDVVGAPLASTAIGSGAIPAISGAASGAIPAAFAAPAAASVVAPAVAAATPSLASRALSSPTLWGTVANTLTQIYGANKAADTASQAAQIAAAAAKYGTDAQSAAAANALAFDKSTAENTYQNTEVTRKANYDQAASQHAHYNAVRSALGLGANDFPAYAPGVDPRFDSSGTPPPAGTPPPSSAAPSNLSDPNAWMSLVNNKAQLTQWVQSGLGANADPGLVDYYVTKIQGQPGANPAEQANGATYWMQKIKNPSPAGASTAAPTSLASSKFIPTTGSVASYLAPPLPPPLQMPQGPYGY